MPNRLAASSSPYLQQHADNPVEWWEWGEDAFAEARRRDVPLLLSVGYAACHWCHVMAHESFEDEGIAGLMNDGFVNVKVDREERPDVDAVYMEAVQGLTGQGGWPMTVFMTSDGEPFYAGTYFPPAPRHGMPSFPQVLAAIGTTWRERRDEVLTAGRSIAEQLAGAAVSLRGDEELPPSEQDLSDAVGLLLRDFDSSNAGYGGAPKFPPSMTLEQLLRHHARTGNPLALAMVERTCEAMARGGMYDQLGGGFARYSVDAGWVVPHFEKMLYDNALLLRVYAHLWRATGASLAQRVTSETAEFLLTDLRTAQGGFASSLDADSEGVEGRSYVWTPQQLEDVLGEDDGRWAARLLTVTADGTFEHGTSVLQLRSHPDDEPRWSRLRDRLRGARAQRVQPARDDKVVASWNGLAIAALADAGAILDRPDLVAAAGVAADAVGAHLDDGRLRRISRDGVVAAHAGVLEDYADLAEGLLALYAVTGHAQRLRTAGALLDTVLARFRDEDGGFFDTADDAERLLRRPQDPTDNATPSGWSAACGALLTYAAYTGSVEHRRAAERGLAVSAVLARRAPRFAGWGLAVAEAYADGPREVAIVGGADDPELSAMRRVAIASTAPGLALAVGPNDDVPLLAGRPLVSGAATAYVCRDFVCERPVTSAAELAGLLAARR